ncbi:MAG: Ig-like domain-containing protein [Abditibacteriaceae bacterium]
MVIGDELEDHPDIHAQGAKFTYSWNIVSTKSRTTPTGTWEDASPTPTITGANNPSVIISTLFGTAAYYQVVVHVSIDFFAGTREDTWHTDKTVTLSQTAVGVDKIQYRIGQGAYADVPNPLVVPVNSNVDFKAIITPAGATWPADKPVWGGAATGTGESSTVTFGQASETTTDFKTITAKCGNTVTANVLVVQVASLEYRFTQNGVGVGDWTAAPNFPEPLIAPLNATIEFKAVRSPAGEEWPPGKPEWSSTGTGITGATGSGESKTVTIDATGNYSVSAKCGETKTVNIVVPSLSIESDRDAICGGGWSAAHGYQYLKKDPDGTTHGYVDREKPDPHLATVEVTAKDGDGNTLSGLDVTLTWDMPGDAPAETQTKTTDANGKASFDVTSGDELSKDTDQDTGDVLFDDPVPVKASCFGVEKTKNLQVVAPEVVWQYKDETGTYVTGNGENWDLYSDERKDIPIRVILTYDNVPVTGHSMSWGIDKIYDKSGTEILPDDPEYSTYGHMSGAISTTTSEGEATATFTIGDNFGQVIFAIDDNSVFTRDNSASSSSLLKTSSLKTSLLEMSAPSGRRKAMRGRYATIKVAEYTWVVGKGTFSERFAYPAPSYEEDNELLQATRSLARDIMGGSGTESKTGLRVQSGSSSQNGSWWFSQVVGNDQESYGVHLADVKVTSTGGKTHYYGAAFDIVLTNVPIFDEGGRRQEFGTYVKGMRDHGIVAWHRWAGESASTSENEMHCVDPATPFIKHALGTLQSNGEISGQIGSFLNGGSGGGYPTEPSTGNFAITQSQQDKVRNRFHHKLIVANAQGDNTQP